MSEPPTVHAGVIALGLVGTAVAVGLGLIALLDLHPCGRGQSAARDHCNPGDSMLLFAVAALVFLAFTGGAVLLERRGVIRITGRRDG